MTTRLASPASSGPLAGEAGREQTRARYPDSIGQVERGGVRVFYEVYGDGEPTVLLVPPWSIVHSRVWKAQIPYLARHFRVIAFDARGNGRSDRPSDAAAYAQREHAADALAILDATSTEQAVVVSLSLGAQPALLLAAEHPERVKAAVFFGPRLPLVSLTEEVYTPETFLRQQSSYEGFEKFNMHYWLDDWADFVEFWFSSCLPEPHSTKQMEDAIGWGLQTTPEAMIASVAEGRLEEPEARELCARISCPLLVVHGDQDAVVPPAVGAELAAQTGGEHVPLWGSGHVPTARDPVRVNLLLRDFIDPGWRRRRGWRRGRVRPQRALYVSSPIGLGHARRDVAIADELRRLRPGLQIDWLAQHPVTAVLEARGERVHPASAGLAGECAHIESEATGHELDCFAALRRMDEVLVANFMVFHDLVQAEEYDLWIGDEAWELDYYLHENPELKSAAYVWLTDFVGWLPMPEGGEREASLTADYNAEMLEQIARYPRVRDRAIFIGEPDDIVPDRFGPDLPRIRDWTEQHYRFAGYATDLDPRTIDRRALRAELGYGPGEKVCVVSAGGSGVGSALLQRVMASFPEAKRRVPDLRMIVVCGPRIDPASLPAVDQVEVRPYVDQLRKHLAACDLAVVQGGLSTTMELTAAGRPFLYFPLARHFEQNLHVHHRLQRHRAGRRMDYAGLSPDGIAEAIADEIDREVDYRPVAPGGAKRAAEMIAELV